jgi:hypothetical protein
MCALIACPNPAALPTLNEKDRKIARKTRKKPRRVEPERLCAPDIATPPALNKKDQEKAI